MSMLREEIRQIVQASVLETLAHLGFTVDDPNAIQRDMIHLRRLREGQEETAIWIKRSAIGVFVTAFLFVVWDGFLKEVVKK
ncbi:MAG: hypothetical protein ACKVOE_03980 [Rickettsiales bacterium]